MKASNTKKNPPVAPPPPKITFREPFRVEGFVSLNELLTLYVGHVVASCDGDRHIARLALGVSLKTIYNRIGQKTAGRYSWRKFRDRV